MATKKKQIIDETPFEENIQLEPMDTVMGDRYARYAKYVIQDRAIPDARDGLKPVQRRIIYSMFIGKNTSKYPTRKCARIVGDVIGKYHPHGDTSVYDALARMSQDWKVRMPLITFQGNNGSIDGDQPAAYRYTEAKLSTLADELIRDLEKNTVDMTLTFDDENLEPNVLPARFPQLYVNGGEGIAVGMATEIPPHNLQEVCEAVIHRINHPDCTIEDLREFVKGPDFPTGGTITKCDGLDSIYTTGRGKIEISAKYEIVGEGTPNCSIIITEIPYKVVKLQLVYEMDKIRHDKVIDGILAVRDESDRKGLRIAIDLKKDAKPQAILKYLFNKTNLKTNYSANIVAIVNGRPKTLSLIDYVDCYIDHQVDVITRRSTFDLKKANARLHIVEGLIKAVSVIDDIVLICRQSKDKADAKKNISNKYGFSDLQADAIVSMQLYKLSNTDVTVLENEKVDLIKNIEFLTGILEDRKKLNKVLIKDLQNIVKNYGNERRTLIKEHEGDNKYVFDKRDLITKEDVYVSVTRDGYIKRSSIRSHNSTNEALPGMKDGDLLVFSNICSTTDYLICFTSAGNYLFVPVNDILDSKWKEEGKHINYMITYNAQKEKIIKAFTLDEGRDDLNFVLVSKRGQIKKTKISEFIVNRYNRTYPAMKLFPSDELADVALTKGNDNVFLLSSDGNASYYSETYINTSGTKSGGVKGFHKLGDAYIVSLLTYDPDEKGKMIIMTDLGHIRIYDISYANLDKRLGKVTNIVKSFKSEIHTVIYCGKIDKKDERIQIIARLNNKQQFEFSWGDFHLTPIDKYAKANILLPKKTLLSKINVTTGLHIDKNIVSNYVEQIKEPTEEVINITENEIVEEETKDGKFEEISLFDEFFED